MINIEDLQRISPVIRMKSLLRESGINPATYWRRINRDNLFLTVDESERITAVLLKYGLTYSTSKPAD